MVGVKGALRFSKVDMAKFHLWDLRAGRLAADARTNSCTIPFDLQPVRMYVSELTLTNTMQDFLHSSEEGLA